MGERRLARSASEWRASVDCGSVGTSYVSTRNCLKELDPNVARETLSDSWQIGLRQGVVVGWRAMKLGQLVRMVGATAAVGGRHCTVQVGVARGSHGAFYVFEVEV